MRVYYAIKVGAKRGSRKSVEKCGKVSVLSAKLITNAYLS